MKGISQEEEKNGSFGLPSALARWHILCFCIFVQKQ